MQGLRMLGDEIKMLQVGDGDRILTKVGDSTWGAGGIKVQKDGPVAHWTRNKPNQRTMSTSTNFIQ